MPSGPTSPHDFRKPPGSIAASPPCVEGFISIDPETCPGLCDRVLDLSTVLLCLSIPYLRYAGVAERSGPRCSAMDPTLRRPVYRLERQGKDELTGTASEDDPSRADRRHVCESCVLRGHRCTQVEVSGARTPLAVEAMYIPTGVSLLTHFTGIVELSRVCGQRGEL